MKTHSLLLIGFMLVGCHDNDADRYFSFDGSFDKSRPAVEFREPELRKEVDEFVLSGLLIDELMKLDDFIPLRDDLKNASYRKEGATGYVLEPPLRIHYKDKVKGDALMKLQSYVKSRVGEMLQPKLPRESEWTSNTPSDMKWPVYFASKLGVGEEELAQWYRVKDITKRASIGTEALEQLRSGDLKMFDCSPFVLDDMLISGLKSAPNLVGLRIGAREEIGDLEWIGEISNLRVLDISGNDFSSSNMQWLCRLRNLSSLWMNRCEMPIATNDWLPVAAQLLEISFDAVVFTEAHLKSMPPLPALTRLSLKDAVLTGKEFEEITRIAPSLEFLWLIRNETLTFRSIPTIGRFRVLRYLDLESSLIEKTEYQTLHGGIPPLEELIPDCAIEYGFRKARSPVAAPAEWKSGLLPKN